MNETRKAIIISTGMDNIQLLEKLQQSETVTGASLNRVKALYAKFAGQKADIEAAANDASLARMRANLDAKLAMQKKYNEEFFANQVAQQEIAGGSVPVSMGGRDLSNLKRTGLQDFESGAEVGVGMAAGLGGAKLIGAAAKKSIEREAELGGTAAAREVFVLIREVLRRSSISRILSSAMRLVSLLAEIPLGMFASVGVGTFAAIQWLPKLWGGTNLGGYLKSTQGLTTWQKFKLLIPGISGSDYQNQDFINMSKKAPEMLKQRIEEQKRPEPIDNKASALAAEDAWKNMTPQQRLTDAMIRQAQIRNEMNHLDPKSLEYAKLQLLYVRAISDGEKAITDEKKAQAETDKKAAEAKKKAQQDQIDKQKEITDLQNQLDQNERDQHKALRDQQQDDLMGIPSLEEAASGGGWLTRLKRYYGGALSNPIQGMSRDYLRQQYGMAHDFEQWSLATGGDYADWLKTTQGSGEKSYLDQLGGNLQALGIVKNDDTATRLADLQATNEQIVQALAKDGIVVKEIISN